MLALTPNEVTVVYKPRGAALEVFLHRDPEIILSGPAGTGKSRAILEKFNAMALKYPRARLLMLRKTRRSLTESGMVTLKEKVLHPLDGVHFHSGMQEFQYPNGSIIAVGGLDKATKVLSSEWDGIYIQECNEIGEDLWEACIMRLRNGVLPYQQQIGDTNPDTPEHWIRKRVGAHKMLELTSHHQDNPLLYGDDGEMTAEGDRYINGTLNQLSGVRRARYLLGLWVAAEGMVYEDVWNRELNIRPRSEYCKPRADGSKPSLFGDCGIDKKWRRFLSVDFGYTHPFVARWYAEDPDGRLIMYREIYRTHQLVEDHAAVMRKYAKWGEVHGDPIPTRIFCDHDAEDRHTLERHLGLHTEPANKDVSTGIQAVAARLRVAGDGKPRLVYLEDSTIEMDPWLAEHKQPTAGIGEVEGYVWDNRKEAPVKENDHAMDTDRYVIASLDLKPKTVTATSFRIY